MRRRRKQWSYKAGRKGWNRVRAFWRKGRYWLEWWELVEEPDGTARRRRCRVLLRDVETEEEAARRADKLAAKFADMEPRASTLTIARLLTLYLKEVTPRKGASKQDHDRRASRVWLGFFDAQPEPDRRSGRHPGTLDRTDWDRFIAWRREGRIPGWGRVRARQVEYDLKFMLSVLYWATGHYEDGRPLLERNPWDAQVRRSQGWEMPREPSPRRPAMQPWIREGLLRHSPHWQFSAALVLQLETKRRNSAIRQLRWNDIDLERAEITWRAETDKTGRANVTPISPRAVELLRSLPSRGIGAAPVFPSATDPATPTSRHTFQTWLRRAKARWLRSIEDEQERARVAALIRGLGFHGEKRAGVRDPRFRQLPPKVQEELAGTNWETLRRIYDDVSVEEMRAALVRAGA